jgi:hypothetical protein
VRHCALPQGTKLKQVQGEPVGTAAAAVVLPKLEPLLLGAAACKGADPELKVLEAGAAIVAGPVVGSLLPKALGAMLLIGG